MLLLTPEERLSILQETIIKIAKMSHEDERVHQIFDASQALGVSADNRFRIALLNKEGTHLKIRYTKGMNDISRPEGINYEINNSLHADVIASEEAKVINKGFGFSTQIQSFAAIPIIRSGDICGVLTLDSSSKNAFDQEMIPLLKTLASLLALAIREAPDEEDESVISVVKRFREQHVLVLGKDSGQEIIRLRSICDTLTKLGYKPVLVKEYLDIPELSNEEKVRVFADHSRFVILENTFPAGQIAEIKMCATNRIITATLREDGKGSSYMVTDYFKDYDFIKEFEYTVEDDGLSEAVKLAANWAELLICERAEYYNDRYPWRKGE